MSSYIQITKHPETGNFEAAKWLDDFYAPHQYGVQFADGKTYRPEGLETIKDYTPEQRAEVDRAFNAWGRASYTAKLSWRMRLGFWLKDLAEKIMK